MSKRAQLWSFILLGFLIMVGAIFAIRGQAELILDEKKALVEERYGLNPVRATIIDRKGGYDASTARYHYEFIIQKDSVPYAVIIYDEPMDLTKETVDKLRAERPSEVFESGG